MMCSSLQISMEGASKVIYEFYFSESSTGRENTFNVFKSSVPSMWPVCLKSCWPVRMSVTR